MLRRCVLELSSSGRSVAKHEGRLCTVQTPFSLSARRGLSNASKPPPGPRDGKKLGLGQDSGAGEKPGSSSLLPKVLLGATVVGAAAVVADEMGFVDIGLRRPMDRKPSLESNNVDEVHKTKHGGGVAVGPDGERSDVSPQLEENTEKKDEVRYAEDTKVTKDDASMASSLEEEPAKSEENEISDVHGDLSPKHEHTSGSEIACEDVEKLNNGLMRPEASSEQTDSELLSQNKVELSSSGQAPSPETTTEDIGPEDVSKVSLEHGTEAPSSLLEAYSLPDEKIPEISSNKEPSVFSEHISTEKEEVKALDITSGSPEDNEKSKDETVVLDLIQAIHTAEKRQAELDFREFEEQKRQLKEEYEKELRDARVRELMFAEEAAMLDKELNKERAKAAATVKMLQDKAEQTLRSELQHKEVEMQDHLKKDRELAKAELNAALANEKASQLEKIAEANLHINALCMAFYARSEEARQSHSVHKLALGALALEDALSKGLPIRAEVDVLRASLADVKSDVLIDLVLLSLPEETLSNGTDTKLQLNQKFDALKGKLRHFSLIPCGGGGILTHTMAYVASSIKIRESNLPGVGIESTISRVESLLAEGKLSEAADALEGGVSGTEAEGVARHWVRQAKNRAITEQALAVLQSYATSISLT